MKSTRASFASASTPLRSRSPSNAELAEDAPVACKDVERVVEVVHQAGIAQKVARLRPMGVVKG